MAQITRLGNSGHARPVYGSFAGKAESVPARVVRESLAEFVNTGATEAPFLTSGDTLSDFINTGVSGADF